MRDEALRHLPPLPPGRSCHLLLCHPASHSPLRSQLSTRWKGQAQEDCVSASISGLLPLPSQTPWQGCRPSLPSPRSWSSGGQGGEGMQAIGSLLPDPPSLSRWVACLPQRLFTECPASLINSGVLDAGTSISASFPLHLSPRLVFRTVDC